MNCFDISWTALIELDCTSFTTDSCDYSTPLRCWSSDVGLHLKGAHAQESCISFSSRACISCMMQSTCVSWCVLAILAMNHWASTSTSGGTYVCIWCSAHDHEYECDLERACRAVASERNRHATSTVRHEHVMYVECRRHLTTRSPCNSISMACNRSSSHGLAQGRKVTLGGPIIGLDRSE